MRVSLRVGFAVLVTVLCLGATSVFAQGGIGGSGELGQQTQRAMQSAMDDLFNVGMGTPTAANLAEKVGQEKLDAFLAAAVVKLTFMPDGGYEAQALEGGEILSFNLGRKKFTPAEDEEYIEGWLIRKGEFEMPKKAQKLSMSLRAGPTEVSVECHNKYGRSEEAVTFYVGPLDGLFCVGFQEEESGSGDEVG